VLTLRWPARLDTNQAFAAGGGAARGARLWALAKALAVGFPRARRWGGSDARRASAVRLPTDSPVNQAVGRVVRNKSHALLE